MKEMSKTVFQVCKSFLSVVPEGLLSSQTSNYHFASANYVFGSNIGIILNFVLSYISNFLLYFQHMMLVNMKLDISECNRIPLQDFRYRFHWSASFSMAAKTELTILAFLLPPATKLGQGNIFRSVCQQFCPRGGRAWLYWGGVRGFIWGGHAWFYSGGMHGFIWGGGRAWFFQFFRIQ